MLSELEPRGYVCTKDASAAHKRGAPARARARARGRWRGRNKGLGDVRGRETRKKRESVTLFTLGHIAATKGGTLWRAQGANPECRGTTRPMRRAARDTLVVRMLATPRLSNLKPTRIISGRFWRRT